MNAEMEQRIAQFASQKVTKKSMQEFVKGSDVKNISKDAFEPLDAVGSTDDAELIYHLLAAAIEITKAAKKITLMKKHLQAAIDAYNRFGDDLSQHASKVTQTELTRIAKKDHEIERVAKKALQTVIEAGDPAVVRALWNCACHLQKSEAIKPSKTVSLNEVETARAMLQCFKKVFTLDPNSASKIDADAEANGEQVDDNEANNEASDMDAD